MQMLTKEKLLKKNQQIQKKLDDPNISIDDLKKIAKRQINFNNLLIEAEDERKEYMKNDKDFKILKEYAFKGFASALTAHEMAGALSGLHFLFNDLDNDTHRNRGLSHIKSIKKLFHGFEQLSQDRLEKITYEKLKETVFDITDRSYIKIDDSCLKINDNYLSSNMTVFSGVSISH